MLTSRRIGLALACALAVCAQTAKFPTAIAMDQDLLKAKDRSASTLTAGIDATQLTVSVADGTQFVAYEVVTIDSEQILICSVAVNTLNVCTGGRGFAGTTGTTHANAAAVRGQVVAWHHNALSEEVKAVETALGANLANVAPVGATFITQTPNAVLTSEQALSLLATGLVKNTTATGVLSIAIVGTDYAAASHAHAAADTTSGVFDPARLPNPGATTLGGIKSLTCAGTDKLSAVGTDGLPVCSADAGGGTPGGSNTQFQWNNAGAFGGTTGLAWNATDGTVTLSNAPPADTTKATWLFGGALVSGAVGGTHIGINPSTFTGNFMDFQVGGASKFKVSYLGNMYGNSFSGTGWAEFGSAEFFGWVSRSRMYSDSDGWVRLSNNAGTARASLDALAFLSSGYAFANLPAATNGTHVYCSDCLKGSDPCSGSSTGAFAQRLSGTWVCSGGGTGANHAFLSATHTDTVAAAPVLGDMLYGNATPAWTKFSGNATTVKKVVAQTGTGTVSAAPEWASLVAGATGALQITPSAGQFEFDIVTAVVPQKSAANTFTGLNAFDLGVVLPPVALPGSPTDGRFIYDTADKRLKYYNSTALAWRYPVVTGEGNTFSAGDQDFSAVAGLRIKTGTGIPVSTGCDAAAEVGRVYIRSDAQAVNASFYLCSQTGVGTYAWELAQSGADITDVGNCATGACFQSVTANQALMSPNGSAGQVSPRALVVADLPSAVLTDTSTHTLTNKTYDAEAAGNALTTVAYNTWLAANCQGATAALGFASPSSGAPTAVCVTGTNTIYGVAQFSDTATQSVQGHFPLPPDWAGNINLDARWRSNTAAGSVVWQVQTVCVADAETGDPAWNAAQKLTDVSKAVAYQFNDAAIDAAAPLTTTGCAAGEDLMFKFFRDPVDAGDTLAATAELIWIRFKIRRQQ